MSRACLGGSKMNPFALQIYGNTGTTGGLLREVKESGATWVRAQIEWGAVEPTNRDPSQFLWAQADAATAGARDGCVHLILTMANNAPWAATNVGGPIDKVGVDELAQFMAAVVERYDGDGVADAPGSPVVTYFEMYNEPDSGPIPGGEGWGTHGAAYADMLKVVYPAIKAANPNAKLVFGGIGHDGFTENGGVFVKSFLDDVLNAGGGDYFDVMNFHQYPAFAGSWTSGKGPGLYEKAMAVRKKLTDHGLNKPLIITETGWHNNNHPTYPSNDEIQGRYVVALMVEGLAANIEVSTWWLLVDIGPTYQFDTGLLTYSTRQRKPAFAIFQLMVRQLENAKYVRTLPASETNNADLAAYEFKDNNTGKKLFVAWLNPIDQPTAPGKPLTLSAEKVTVIDMLGNTSVVNDTDDGADNGKVTLTVSRPVYIHVTQ